ncbi:MAG: DUF2203 domain-containing protein [Thermomicrobiales bacterium]
MAQRYFTLEEATALLPRLRTELGALRAENEELARCRTQLARLRVLLRSNGHAAEALSLEARAADLLQTIGACLEASRALGIELKDLEHGLVDFPSWREGRVVYLCWRLDEEHIGYWHELDAGFQGRQPL